jgi:hypothetical protein
LSGIARFYFARTPNHSLEAAGAVAKLIAKEGKSATLKLPSGEVRLSFRLFGNILADELVVVVLVSLVPLVVRIPVMLLGDLVY